MELLPNDYILIVLLALSLYFDLVRRKVPNFLTLPAAAAGIVLCTFSGRLEGLIFSLAGMLLGGALLLIPFALGGMGGGDVKLLAAVGALKGAWFTLEATLFAALCGGIMAAVLLAARGELRETLIKILRPALSVLYLRFKLPLLNVLLARTAPAPVEGERSKPGALPYAVPIALGVLIVLTGAGERLVLLAGL